MHAHTMTEAGLRIQLCCIVWMYPSTALENRSLLIGHARALPPPHQCRNVALLQHQTCYWLRHAADKPDVEAHRSSHPPIDTTTRTYIRPEARLRDTALS